MAGASDATAVRKRKDAEGFRPLPRSHPVGGFAPADVARGRDRPEPFDTLERETDIGGAAGLERGIDEKLLEHVLLRVTAAELVHAADGRARIKATASA